MQVPIAKAQQYYHYLQFCVKHKGWSYQMIEGTTEHESNVHYFEHNGRVRVTRLMCDAREVIRLELYENGWKRETIEIIVPLRETI